MKLWRPRFSVLTLVIFVTLVAFVVWWVTWPQKTAERFLGLYREGRFDEASQLAATTQDREFLERLRKGQDVKREFLKTRRLDSEVDREIIEMVREEPDLIEMLRKEPELNPELLKLLSEDRELIGSKPNGTFPPVKMLDRTWSDIVLGRGEVHLGIDSARFVQRGRASLFSGFEDFD